ncbi:hypothetical protein HYH03_006695 [Edaphochlamys debaryana]|uniref:Uncharacterized protein n=1 Tax=Edaphochlamys debaryana TaxID=47281 RepID=A0A836C123_9CHLO|nr:hypothetical protein HYH03_006695 [Edaphochlamys debaryana]|eukprot:KAG2495084.1 hypothetical protein HYH03_006695 [Edaphochlamys debaryana]
MDCCRSTVDDGNLLQLFAAVCGAGSLSAWQAGIDPCTGNTTTWPYVACTNGAVSKINLTNLDLNCDAPATWFQGASAGLEGLRELYVTNCTRFDANDNLARTTLQIIDLSFTTPANPGAVLPDLIGLSGLRSLRARDYGFQGYMPDWLDLTALSELRLSGNQLTDSIPPAWSNLVSLQILDLNGNPALCGAIPTGLKACSLFGFNNTKIGAPGPAKPTTANPASSTPQPGPAKPTPSNTASATPQPGAAEPTPSNTASATPQPGAAEPTPSNTASAAPQPGAAEPTPSNTASATPQPGAAEPTPSNTASSASQPGAPQSAASHTSSTAPHSGTAKPATTDTPAATSQSGAP